MMKKYCAAALIAASAFLAAGSGGAFARDTARSPQPQQDSAVWAGESGTASYYGATYHSRREASGALFDQMAMTAAHPWLPFGTRIRVTLADSGRSVVVPITDRIYSSRRILDLS